MKVTVTIGGTDATASTANAVALFIKSAHRRTTCSRTVGVAMTIFLLMFIIKKSTNYFRNSYIREDGKKL